jgi:hypothetical protein
MGKAVLRFRVFKERRSKKFNCSIVWLLIGNLALPEILVSSTVGRRANIYLKRSAEVVGLVGYSGSLGVLLESEMTVWKGGFAACGFAYKLGCDSKQLRNSAECRSHENSNMSCVHEYSALS